MDEGGHGPGSNVAAFGGAQGISSQPIFMEMQEPSAPPPASAMSAQALPEANDGGLCPAPPQSAGLPGSGTLTFGSTVKCKLGTNLDLLCSDLI